MPAVVNILSYFSLTTDLAVALSSWPEYRDGRQYDVTLCSIDGAEEVTTRLLHAEENGTPYVRVASSSGGALFERVLGRVIFELAAAQRRRDGHTPLFLSGTPQQSCSGAQTGVRFPVGVWTRACYSRSAYALRGGPTLR